MRRLPPHRGVEQCGTPACLRIAYRHGHRCRVRPGRNPTAGHRLPRRPRGSFVLSSIEGSTLVKLLRRPAALGTILALGLGTFTLSAAPPATAEYNSVGSTPLMGWSS